MDVHVRLNNEIFNRFQNRRVDFIKLRMKLKDRGIEKGVYLYNI